MMLSLLVIAIVLGCAWVWMSRGFFSGLINLACVLVAGAIAFAFWEQLAYALLKAAPDRGFLSFLGGTAWAIALGLPFAAALALLRVATDAALPGNAQVEPAVDYAGGAITGACSGLIIAGFVALSISFLRLPPDQFGYSPIAYGSAGNIARQDKLWLPADKLTSQLYGHFSLASLKTGTPLADLYPDLHEAGGGMRTSFAEGKARNTYKPTDFQYEGRYFLGDADKSSIGQLVTDQWDGNPQVVQDVDGNPVGPGHVEGYTVTFLSGAKEKGGQVVVGNAQIRLVCEDEADGKYQTVYPFAVVCQADSANPAAARFRFDSTNVFIASVGGASESTMAFEFAVPKGYKSKYLYVKNVRHEVGDENPKFKFASIADRDAAINDGRVIKGITGAAIRSGGGAAPAGQSTFETENGGLMISRSIGYTLQRGNERGLQLNENNSVIDGEAAFAPEDIKRGNAVDRALRVDKFTTRDDTVVCQVEVSGGNRTSLLGRSLDTALTVVPPVLIDSNGQQYEPVGYVYEDNQMIKIRFTPQQPMRGLTELPAALSKSRPDQKVKLVFMVSWGVTIERFQIGPEVITDWTKAPLKPVKLTEKQR
ncbi:MAG: CvpA family protein [Phycisphaerales bacterium]|nr:CvpA family protein [Phycisphaerales bacterium]